MPSRVDSLLDKEVGVSRSLYYSLLSVCLFVTFYVIIDLLSNLHCG